MNLIKLGPDFINVDRVAVVRDLSPEAGGGGPRLVRIEFAGGGSIELSTHAQGLLDWATENAVDATATEPPGPAPR